MSYINNIVPMIKLHYNKAKSRRIQWQKRSQFQSHDIRISSKVKLNQLDVFGQKNLIFKSEKTIFSASRTDRFWLVDLWFIVISFEIKFFPSSNSMKNNGKASNISMIKYGMRNAPPPCL